MSASNTLIFTNVPRESFEDDGRMIKELLMTYGELRKLVVLESFGRILCVFESTELSKYIKTSLHKSLFKGNEIRVYFGQHTDLYSRPNLLTVPQPHRNLLMSPPGSPAVGWTQALEAGPGPGGIDDELLASTLSCMSLNDFTLDGGRIIELNSLEDMVSDRSLEDMVTDRSDMIISFNGDLPQIIVDSEHVSYEYNHKSSVSSIPRTSLPLSR